MDAESLLMEGLSTLACRTDGRKISLGENMALLIAEMWEARTCVDLHMSDAVEAVRAARREPWFVPRAYELWDAINALAYDGHPPVELSSRDALCVLGLLCNSKLVGDARDHYSQLDKEAGW